MKENTFLNDKRRARFISCVILSKSRIISRKYFYERVISLGYFLLVCRKKKLYLRIGEGGSPIVCGKNEAKVFDDIKAQNVLDHLPKVLQKMNFVKEPVVQSELNISDEEEIPSKKTVIAEKTVVKNTSYNTQKLE